ncbi:hypothetical protein, partial [Couchioplanes caeruleus]
TREIAAARGATPPRTVTATVYDAVELPVKDHGLPPMVAESHRLAGTDPLPATKIQPATTVSDAAAARPRPRLGHVRGIIGYEHRTLTVPGPGGPRKVQDFTVELNLKPQDPEAERDLRALKERIRAAVEATFNAGYRIGPDGDQFHVHVDFDDEAGHPVDVYGDQRDMSQTEWSTAAGDLKYAHEIGHFLGLYDEYGDTALRDHDGNLVKRVFHRDSGSANVHDDASIMATTDPAAAPQLHRRHLDTIADLAGQSGIPDRLSVPPDSPGSDEFLGDRPALGIEVESKQPLIWTDRANTEPLTYGMAHGDAEGVDIRVGDQTVTVDGEQFAQLVYQARVIQESWAGMRSPMLVTACAFGASDEPGSLGADFFATMRHLGHEADGHAFTHEAIFRRQEWESAVGVLGNGRLRTCSARTDEPGSEWDPDDRHTEFRDRNGTVIGVPYPGRVDE